MNHSSTCADTTSNAVPALQLSDFSNIRGPNGEIILVPRYMVPLAELRLEGVRQAAEMPLHEAKNGVCLQLIIHYFFDISILDQPRRLPIYDSALVAEGRVYADPEPVRPPLNLTWPLLDM